VAGTFLKKLREKEFKENQAQNPQAPEKDADDEKWENLSEYA